MTFISVTSRAESASDMVSVQRRLVERANLAIQEVLD